jgi:hypothetical protein
MGHFSPTAEKLAEKALGRARVPPGLDQDIQHDPILIDCSPELMDLASDPDQHLIEVPFIPGFWPSSLERCRELPSKPDAPLSDALMWTVTPRPARISSTSRKLREKR